MTAMATYFQGKLIILAFGLLTLLLLTHSEASTQVMRFPSGNPVSVLQSPSSQGAYGFTAISQPIFNVVNYGIILFSAVSDNLMFGVSGTTLKKSTNGGSTWTTVSTPTLASVNSLQALDANNIIIGGNLNFWVTTNGGSTWTTYPGPQYLSNPIGVYEYSWASLSTGYAEVAPNGQIMKTVNGGASWTYLGFLNNTGISVGVGYGTIIAGSTLWTSPNDGVTQYSTGLTLIPGFSAYWVSSTELYLFGASAYVSPYSIWHITNAGTGSQAVTLIANNNALGLINSTTWAIGLNSNPSLVEFTTNAGISYTVPSPVNGGLNGIAQSVAGYSINSVIGQSTTTMYSLNQTTPGFLYSNGAGVLSWGQVNSPFYQLSTGGQIFPADSNGRFWPGYNGVNDTTNRMILDTENEALWSNDSTLAGLGDYAFSWEGNTDAFSPYQSPSNTSIITPLSFTIGDPYFNGITWQGEYIDGSSNAHYIIGDASGGVSSFIPFIDFVASGVINSIGGMIATDGQNIDIPKQASIGLLGTYTADIGLTTLAGFFYEQTMSREVTLVNSTDALDVKGSVLIENASSHSGQATCWATSGRIGYCTSVVGVGGACTCTAL